MAQIQPPQPHAEPLTNHQLPPPPPTTNCHGQANWNEPSKELLDHPLLKVHTKKKLPVAFQGVVEDGK